MSLCDACGSDVNSEKKTSTAYLSPRTFHEALTLCMENTTIHGLGHIWNNRRNLFVIFWIIVFGICFFSVTFASDSYLRGFFDRTIHSQSEVRWSLALPMPSIAVCNRGFLSKRKLEALNVDPRASNLMIGMIAPLFVMNPKKLSSPEMRVPLEEASANITGIMKKHNFTFRQLIEEVSYSCEDLIKGCTVNLSYYPGAKCCLFMQPLPSMAGLCHTFYAGNDTYQGLSGDFMGLNFYVRIPQNDTPDIFQDFLKRSIMMKKGIQATPMSNVTHPSTSVLGDGVQLSPSFITSLKIAAVEKNQEETKISYLDYNTEPCIPGGELDYTKDKKKFKNTYANCYLWAFDTCSLQICKCNLYASDSDSEMEDCSPLEAVDCMLMINHYNVTERKRFEVCIGKVLSSCRVICRETSFTFTVANTLFDELHVDEEIENVTNGDTLAVLSLYYGSFDYTHIKYWREGVSELLSKQGGQMGMFLGCSLISLIEVVVFFLVLAVSLCRTVYRKLRWGNATVQPVSSKLALRMRIKGTDEREVEPTVPPIHF